MAHKQSKTKNSFISSHGQAGVWLFPEEWAATTSNRDLGKLLSSLQMSLLLLLSMMPGSVGYPTGQLWLAVPSMSLQNSLSTLSLLTAGVRSRKGLGIMQALLNSTTSLFQYHCFQHKSKTLSHPSCCKENYPTPVKTR